MEAETCWDRPAVVGVTAGMVKFLSGEPAGTVEFLPGEPRDLRYLAEATLFCFDLPVKMGVNAGLGAYA
jgi:hypothetical protein